MITAPLMLNAIKLDLPKNKEVNPLNLNTKQVVLSYTLSKGLFVGKDQVLKSELIDIVKNEFKSTKSDTLFLRADFSMKYGDVASLMSFLKRGGIGKVALVTEVSDK